MIQYLEELIYKALSIKKEDTTYIINSNMIEVRIYMYSNDYADDYTFIISSNGITLFREEYVSESERDNIKQLIIEKVKQLTT